MTIILFIMALVLSSGCTIELTSYRPLPPPKIYNFSVRPLDPPIQDDDEKVCVPIGWDGLLCRDQGMRI